MKQTITALITPLLDDPGLPVDFESLEKLLRIQEDANNGIVLLGSTGEGLAFTEEEKREIARFACSLRLRVPLIMGVGGFQLPQTLEWLRFCESLSIDGYLMSNPIYSRPGIQGQTAWFQTLLDAITKPAILYNHPGRSGSPIAIETIHALILHPNFYGIKEASGDPKIFTTYRKADPLKQHLYLGNDDCIVPFAPLGADGLISVIGNLWPLETHKIVADSLAGILKESPAQWLEATRLANICNPVSVKAYLHAKGLIKTPNLRPPMHHSDIKHLKKLFQCELNQLSEVSK